jgi:hypothetical protein
MPDVVPKLASSLVCSVVLRRADPPVVYTGPFTVAGTSTVKYFSTDIAGNAGTVNLQSILIDTTAPLTTIACNASACSPSGYQAAVQVTLTATDNSGGSGVDKTYYTTDGTTPTTTSTVYTGPFTVAGTSTVKYFSTDVAGNSGTVKSQIIQIDAAAPTVSLTQPANGASFAQGSRVTITASASDLGTNAGAPSGIANVAFYLDGTLLATDSRTPYTNNWNTNKVAKGTHTLTAATTPATTPATRPRQPRSPSPSHSCGPGGTLSRAVPHRLAMT